MNTFYHAVCCMLHICAVAQTILWDSQHSHNINMTNAKNITYSACLQRSGFKLTSGRCECPCWQEQLKCEWKAKPQNCEADAQEPAGFLTTFLHKLAYFVSVGLLRTKFQVSTLLFWSMWQYGRGKLKSMLCAVCYQQKQQILFKKYFLRGLAGIPFWATSLYYVHGT